MDRPYFFVNPLDHMNSAFETLDEATSCARTYIGKEDAFGEDIESITIYKCEVAEVASVADATEPGTAPDHSTESTTSPEAKKKAI